VNNRDKAERIRTPVYKLVINVLFDDIICQYLNIGVNLACSLRSCTPETILELEPYKPVLVMGMPFREAEASVNRENLDDALMRVASYIRVTWLIGNLNESVSLNGTLVAYFPQKLLFVIVLIPYSLKKSRDSMLIGFRDSEGNAIGESKVGEPVGKSTNVVERYLCFACFSTICPVMPESKVESPSLRISIQTRAMDFELLIG
jgi:hypothetical protein